MGIVGDDGFGRPAVDATIERPTQHLRKDMKRVQRTHIDCLGSVNIISKIFVALLLAVIVLAWLAGDRRIRMISGCTSDGNLPDVAWQLDYKRTSSALPPSFAKLAKSRLRPFGKASIWSWFFKLIFGSQVSVNRELVGLG